MKKITGFVYSAKIPQPATPPCLPYGLVLMNGDVVDRTGAKMEGGPQFKLFEPIEDPDGAWIGVKDDFTAVVLGPGEEKKWAANKATWCLEEAQKRMKTEPLHAVRLLHASAALVSLSLPELTQAVETAKKTPDEPLESVMDRIRSKQ